MGLALFDLVIGGFIDVATAAVVIDAGIPCRTLICVSAGQGAIGHNVAGSASTTPNGENHMTDQSTLWDMEERFWIEGADAARRMTAKDAVFVFPYPAGILQGDALFRESDVAQRWRSVEMGERHFSRQENIAVLAYRVSAERSDLPIYEALCTSTYLKDDKTWLRLSHSQTPITGAADAG